MKLYPNIGNFLEQQQQFLSIIILKQLSNVLNQKSTNQIVRISAISLLRENANKLQEENAVLKKALAKKTPFLKEYYKLTSKEQLTVQERLKLIIKLMPSNQVRKEEFEIINCSA